MKRPPARFLSRLVRYLTAFALGAITGSALFLFLFGQQLDDHIARIEELKAKNEKLAAENRDLSAQLEKRTSWEKSLKVQKVEIVIEKGGEGELDKLTELEVMTRAAREVQFLKNKPLEIVAELHDSLRQIFHDKKYEINERTVTVNLEAISIYKTVRIWLNVREEK
ncbi:hypothetical protein BSNK01_24870 [Bacillaceae bacterium]